MELINRHIYRHLNTGDVFYATHPAEDVWVMGAADAEYRS
jgi:hypothetical protein